MKEKVCLFGKYLCTVSSSPKVFLSNSRCICDIGPLSVCEQRDPKGLYVKARNGEIQQFTGIDSSYEIPENADITLHTANTTVERCVELMLTKIYCFLQQGECLKSIE